MVTPNPSRGYAKWLWLLAGLFGLRVIAQFTALVMAVWFLPSFESWHSGVMPYYALVAVQVLILVWLVWTAGRFTTGAISPCAVQVS